MRTLPRILPPLTFIGMSVSLGGCHDPGNPWNECWNNRPHSYDTQGGNSAAIFNIVYSCRTRHQLTNTYHTYCIMPDGHEVFACGGPPYPLEQELGPDEIELVPWDGPEDEVTNKLNKLLEGLSVKFTS